jgi:hypothetical protein
MKVAALLEALASKDPQAEVAFEIQSDFDRFVAEVGSVKAFQLVRRGDGALDYPPRGYQGEKIPGVVLIEAKREGG